MSRFRNLALGVAASVAVAPGLVGQESSRQVPADLRARFGFLGPVRHKVGDGLDLLCTADFDGDGRAEAVVEDPRRGRLVVLSLEDDGESLAERTVDTGGVLAGLAAADVTGDGAPELVLLDRRGRLAARRLEGAGSADAPRFPEIEVGAPARNDALRCADLDADGRADAVCLTQEGLRVVTGVAGEPQVGVAIPIGEGEARSFMLADVDGDGHTDVVVTTGDERMPLRIARGDGAGGFGPWLLFPVERVARAFVGAGTAAGGATLAAIRGARSRVVDHVVERSDAPGADGAVQFVALPAVKRGAFPFATGDFDGDGAADLALVHPERAELFFLLERDGRFEVETAPTLAGVTSLAAGDVDGDGRDDLVLASPEEKTLAWWSGARPRAAFPARILAGVEPLTAAVEPDGDVLVLVRDGRREATLQRVTRDGSGFGAAQDLAKIARVSGEPQRMICAEIDANPGLDVAVVLPGDGLRVLSGDGDGGYGDVDPRADDAVELAPRIEDGALALTQAEGAPALLVARGRYARHLRLDAEGLPVVHEQVNAPAGASELALGASLADGTLLLVDRKSSQLFRVGPSGSPVPVALPSIGASHVLAHGEGGDAVVLGRGGVVRARFGAGWVLRELRACEPIDDDTEFYGGIPADLDADGHAELAVADADLHGFHVLVAGDEELRRALAVPVYEPPDQSQARHEPRMMDSADCDGDGRADLVLVAFDRVLIYLQQP